eukprot:CAMPEP_0184097328 /NCGR_PEP_ID=MMETSP0974-20121125/10748_1 /TAXON_ID=483370 /ORGANISM="non described non described, Strain CCMP2097" /LENGTH=39 /DNA_ID= /DNA_START= /DNA_END= /DNA_ORIENTATION=
MRSRQTAHVPSQSRASSFRVVALTTAVSSVRAAGKRAAA